MPRFAYYDRSRAATPVPAGVRFGTKSLIVPTLEEAGIPRLAAKIPLFEPAVDIGDWVERDQTILRAKVPVFDSPDAPSRWTPWVQDSSTTLQYELTSPVSGLVVNILKSYGAYHGEARATNSGLSLCYGEWATLPVLLIPLDEPPPRAWSWSFYSSIAESLCSNRRRLLYSHRDGYRRLAEILDQFEPAEVAALASFCGQSNQGVPPTKIVDVSGVVGTEAIITEMRSHASLRGLLKHIGGMA